MMGVNRRKGGEKENDYETVVNDLALGGLEYLLIM